MEEFKDKSKFVDIAHEGDYMKSKSLNQVRGLFRISSHMVNRIKAKFKNMHRDTHCEGCFAEVDSQSHAYDDLRVGSDLRHDVDLVN